MVIFQCSVFLSSNTHPLGYGLPSRHSIYRLSLNVSENTLLILTSPPLQLAARNGHADSIRVLVEKGGADVQERNATTGWVALHEAAFRGHLNCVKVQRSSVSQ